MKKLIAILLTIFSLTSALKSSMGLYSYSIAFLFPKNHQMVAETYFVSWMLLITHFLQVVIFFALSYYGASVIVNMKKNYSSNAWLNIGVFSVILLVVEFLLNAMPLRQVEGFVPSSTFIETLIEIITNPSILKSQVFPLLTFATFFGLYSSLKQKENK